MPIVVTHPGKFGDLLWSMPTARAIAERAGEPVDLLVSPYVASLVPLLAQQPYLREVAVHPDWHVQMTAPLTPREPPAPYDWRDRRIYHLGYDGWPTPDVARDPARRCGVEIDLTRPWITARPFEKPSTVVVGFTDEHFELKLGLTTVLRGWWPLPGDFIALTREESRWANETPPLNMLLWQTDWLAAARFMAGASVFFGCCSALHVLAVAMGKPVVLMEPSEHRWNPVFYPLGMDGPQVTVVRGTDGRPTFDARHCRETLEAVLARTQVLTSRDTALY